MTGKYQPIDYECNLIHSGIGNDADMLQDYINGQMSR